MVGRPLDLPEGVSEEELQDAVNEAVESTGARPEQIDYYLGLHRREIFAPLIAQREPRARYAMYERICVHLGLKRAGPRGSRKKKWAEAETARADAGDARVQYMLKMGELLVEKSTLEVEVGLLRAAKHFGTDLSSLPEDREERIEELHRRVFDGPMAEFDRQIQDSLFQMGRTLGVGLDGLPRAPRARREELERRVLPVLARA